MQETCEIDMMVEGHSACEHSHTDHHKLYIYPELFVLNKMQYLVIPNIVHAIVVSNCYICQNHNNVQPWLCTVKK